jgi:ABC-type Fe3+ transport system substrate-binding protein
MAELVASGEIPLAATIYNHNAERLVVKGAPIRWKALKPTFGRPNAIGVTRRAPHPYAALLFADFMLSLEGQTILKERNRVPSSRAVDTHLNKFPSDDRPGDRSTRPTAGRNFGRNLPKDRRSRRKRNEVLIGAKRTRHETAQIRSFREPDRRWRPSRACSGRVKANAAAADVGTRAGRQQS